MTTFKKFLFALLFGLLFLPLVAQNAKAQSLPTGKVGGAISLRANLLRWATLTPDLGLEWRISRSWGVLVNGSYLGAMYKAGAFNYKLSATGRQGDLMGGGITGGYQLRLNDALSLDFNLAVGCLHADYEKYEVIDGVRVIRGNETKNWWGPVGAGVTLVWTIK